MTRLALVCDFLEDKWYSMDLVADMLHDNLTRDFADVFETARICPPMTMRLSQAPWLGRNGRARNADQLLNRFLDYPRFIGKARKQFDLFHVVDHTYSQLLHELPAGRTVVTCHDLDAFRCLLEPERDPRSAMFRAMTRRILSGFQKAARVTCDSSAIREEILAHGLLPPERVSVIPLGVHPSYTALPEPASDAEAARLLGPASARAIDILHVGSVIPRKRIDVLLAVFARVRERIPEARLIRVGGTFNEAQWALADRLKLRASIVVMPYISRETLAAVYRRATVVLQPSSGEGFGLPVVEAMSCGTPVIASDLAVLRELGGDAAVYCPVGDVEAWSAQVLELLSKRAGGAEWERVRNEALDQAAQFSPAAYVAKVVEVYRELM